MQSKEVLPIFNDLEKYTHASQVEKYFAFLKQALFGQHFND